MIYNYPHFPTKSYRNYPHNVNINPLYTKSMPIKMNRPPRENNVSPQKNNNIKSNKKLKDEKLEDTYFEILGIKLYYDDILLLCLIFFLYKEGVQDEYLFIALIMLLLS